MENVSLQKAEEWLGYVISSTFFTLQKYLGQPEESSFFI